MPESRLLKYNEENLAKKSGLEEAAKAGALTPSGTADKSSSGRKGGRDTSEVGERKSGTPARGTKRSRDTVEQVS